MRLYAKQADGSIKPTDETFDSFEKFKTEARANPEIYADLTWVLVPEGIVEVTPTKQTRLVFK